VFDAWHAILSWLKLLRLVSILTLRRPILMTFVIKIHVNAAPLALANKRAEPSRLRQTA
jgi:hypothetical protein